MPHSDERKTAAVIIENREEKLYAASMAFLIMFMLCFYALFSRFYL